MLRCAQHDSALAGRICGGFGLRLSREKSNRRCFAALGMTAHWRGESVAIIGLPCKPMKPIVFVQVMCATWLVDAEVLSHLVKTAQRRNLMLSSIWNASASGIDDETE